MSTDHSTDQQQRSERMMQWMTAEIIDTRAELKGSVALNAWVNAEPGRRVERTNTGWAAFFDSRLEDHASSLRNLSKRLGLDAEAVELGYDHHGIQRWTEGFDAEEAD